MQLLLIFVIAWAVTASGFWQAVGAFGKWFAIIIVIGWPIGWVMVQLGIERLPPIASGIIGWSCVAAFIYFAYFHPDPD